jgi:cell division protein FtsB
MKPGSPAAATVAGTAGAGQAVDRAQRWEQLLRGRARLVGSVLLILIALLLAWDVIYGQNGLSAWSAKRAHDRQLTQEIERLREENAALSHRIDRLRDDPEAIEYQARQSLHYARPNEVIYALPASSVSGQPTLPKDGSDGNSPR